MKIQSLCLLGFNDSFLYWLYVAYCHVKTSLLLQASLLNNSNNLEEHIHLDGSKRGITLRISYGKITKHIELEIVLLKDHNFRY